MKAIKNIFKTLGIATCVGVMVASCDLDLLPLNEVVLENYWKDKSDVENVLTSCYVALQSSDLIEKALIWGEVRSDNIGEGQNINNRNDLKNILRGDFKDDNAACNWVSFYTVINRCNTVIHYAPDVADKDPNYTPSELNITLAEAKTLRALCYFYLIRTFKNVPFTFAASIDDNQQYQLPATKDVVVLDSLIDDLESVKAYSRLQFTGDISMTDFEKNSGRVTRQGLLALLADLYLWKASNKEIPVAEQTEAYQQCVKTCDELIAFKRDQYKNSEYLRGTIDQNIYGDYGLPLYSENGNNSESSNVPHAYNLIFGRSFHNYGGNSFESLMEITYTKTSSNDFAKNTSVACMYGGYATAKAVSSVAWVGGSNTLMELEIGSLTSYNPEYLFSVRTDYRANENFIKASKGSYQIKKYVSGTQTSLDFGTVGKTYVAPSESFMSMSYSGQYYGWILYRLSDVILMRAEAQVELAGLLNPDATPVEEEPLTTEYKPGEAAFGNAAALYNDAFNMLSAVYMRSNPEARNTTSARPARENFKTYEAMANLVEAERRRELLFEGKRYFDLVRRARREGNTDHLAQAIQKRGNTTSALSIKLKRMDFMYMPYAESELDVNPNLSYTGDMTNRQNPAHESTVRFEN